MVDRLDSQLYYELKRSIREANNTIANDDLGLFEMPIILINFNNYDSRCFYDEQDVKSYVETNMSDYLSEYPEGEDENLVLIKYCTEEHKNRWDSLYDNYKPYKEINGSMIYRENTCIEFELETVVNINV